MDIHTAHFRSGKNPLFEDLAERDHAEQIRLKRIEKIEEITTSFKGVDRSFAIQAGREVRIIVNPEDVSDAEMTLLARDIVKKIESDVNYPGQIKVNIVRETRAVDYAK